MQKPQLFLGSKALGNLFLASLKENVVTFAASPEEAPLFIQDRKCCFRASSLGRLCHSHTVGRWFI